MKQNRYDDEAFFQKYGEMSRSKDGLAAAGEWPTLEKLLPDFTGKRVLDLGCGYGWHCMYALEHCADYVVGVDLSTRMLEIAKEKAQGKPITYVQSAMEDIAFSKDEFDIVLSSLAFHYVKEYEEVIKRIAHCLKIGGALIFSAEHPVFTAEGSQDWTYREDGEIAHFPVDDYYIEGARTAHFLGEEIIKYHRTLTSYLDTLLVNGFVLERVVEPKPTEEAVANIPGMKDELRRPMMLIVKARKVR